MLVVVSKENTVISPIKVDSPVEVDVHSQPIYFIRLSDRSSKRAIFLQLQIIGKFFLKTKRATLIKQNK